MARKEPMEDYKIYYNSVLHILYKAHDEGSKVHASIFDYQRYAGIPQSLCDDGYAIKLGDYYTITRKGVALWWRIVKAWYDATPYTNTRNTVIHKYNSDGTRKEAAA